MIPTTGNNIRATGRTQPVVRSLAEIFDIDDLIMSTAAYYLGRMTANVDDFCSRVIEAWPLLGAGTQEYIERIVEDAFARESLAKTHGWEQNIFGMECDRESWSKVRQCWSI